MNHDVHLAMQRWVAQWLSVKPASVTESTDVQERLFVSCEFVFLFYNDVNVINGAVVFFEAANFGFFQLSTYSGFVDLSVHILVIG